MKYLLYFSAALFSSIALAGTSCSCKEYDQVPVFDNAGNIILIDQCIKWQCVYSPDNTNEWPSGIGECTNCVDISVEDCNKLKEDFTNSALQLLDDARDLKSFVDDVLGDIRYDKFNYSQFVGEGAVRGQSTTLAELKAMRDSAPFMQLSLCADAAGSFSALADFFNGVDNDAATDRRKNDIAGIFAGTYAVAQESARLLDGYEYSLTDAIDSIDGPNGVQNTAYNVYQFAQGISCAPCKLGSPGGGGSGEGEGSVGCDCMPCAQAIIDALSVYLADIRRDVSNISLRVSNIDNRMHNADYFRDLYGASFDFVDRGHEIFPTNGVFVLSSYVGLNWFSRIEMLLGQLVGVFSPEVSGETDFTSQQKSKISDTESDLNYSLSQLTEHRSWISERFEDIEDLEEKINPFRSVSVANNKKIKFMSRVYVKEVGNVDPLFDHFDEIVLDLDESYNTGDSIWSIIEKARKVFQFFWIFMAFVAVVVSFSAFVRYLLKIYAWYVKLMDSHISSLIQD